MQPAEAGAPLYIARLDALLQAPLGAPPPEAASPQGMYAEVAWFYRPQVRGAGSADLMYISALLPLQPMPSDSRAAALPARPSRRAAHLQFTIFISQPA
jgi:hypothetical protein